MIIPDANLLLYAYDAESPFRSRCAAWWSECLSGTEPVGLTPVVIFAFIRVATNPRAFKRPLSVQFAAALVLEWLDQPNVQLVEMQARDIQEALVLLDRAGTGGKLTTDAQIAAVTLRLGAIIHTGDTDFARFPQVRWFNPITGKKQK